MSSDHPSKGRAPKRPPSHRHGGAFQKTASAGGKRPGNPNAAGRREAPRREPPGFIVRALAVRLVDAVTRQGRALDDALAREFALEPGRSLETRDRGLARLIASTVLRRMGELDAVIGSFIDRPLPDDRGLLTPILQSAAAQLLFLDIAPHAVINIAVEQCRRDRGARRFDRLANAVLRRVSERGREIVEAGAGARLNIPDWMWPRWVGAYGEPIAQRIAEASLTEAALDISARTDAAEWAQRLDGTLLPTGSIRLSGGSRIEDLEGFADGAWWVQDAAAALPARLLGDVRGLRVADLAAAPGGKTLQLAGAGALVTAVDISGERLSRVRENLQRVGLQADVLKADILDWSPAEPFDAVLLDAPCIATGTIRRHPDILRLRRPGDVAKLAQLQARMLERAAALVRPGGLLVYCTCSMEPEECEQQIPRLLRAQPSFARVAVTAPEVGGEPQWISADGDLRTLPFHMTGPGHCAGGMDGFFASRLRRLT
ncbi:MAG: RsmB/NOP family class I SAM-dependent RNA methyltransferase [Hyphomicrobiaceae bacterium]